jgi:hypothetical protein
MIEDASFCKCDSGRYNELSEYKNISVRGGYMDI